MDSLDPKFLVSAEQLLLGPSRWGRIYSRIRALFQPSSPPRKRPTVEKATARLDHRTHEIELPVAGGVHRFELTVCRLETGEVHEVVFTGRGKVGHGLDLVLQDLGPMISRAIQDRDPMTGERLP